MRRLAISRTNACIVAALALGALTAATASAHSSSFPTNSRQPGYSVRALVSDQAGVAAHTDPNRQGWGISECPATPWWVSNQATNTSTLYDGFGSGFLVSNGTTDVPARFIFATLSGTIQASPSPPPAATSTTTKVDNSASHTVYTGLAISPDNGTLYAADFANAKVDMFDSTWAPRSTPGAFSDPYRPAGSGASASAMARRASLRPRCSSPPAPTAARTGCSAP